MTCDQRNFSIFFSQTQFSALFVHVTTGLRTADKCLCRYICELETEMMKLNRLFTNAEAIQSLFRMNCRRVYNLTLRRYPSPI